MNNTLIETSLEQSVERIRSNIPRFGDKFPYYGDGKAYVLTDNNHWMTSFWTGQLWLAYAVTGDDGFRRVAESQLANFEHRLVNRIDESHDLGFLFTLSARAQWQLTQNQDARKLAIAAAERLITRFHPKGQYIQAWGAMNDPVDGGRVIIDSLMNLPLLFWATHETSDPKFADVALAHAQTTLHFLVRPDATTFHTYFFDQDTGEPIGGKTAQGYADDSLWSRGQAWAIYGFALAAEWTNEGNFTEVSRRLAERFWTELSNDLIPLWDFRLSPEAPQKRDSSAGAIATCGMFKLATLVNDSKFSATLNQRAEKMLIRLTQACFDTAPEAHGLLRDASYNVNTNRAVEQFMPFGDYFYLESLVRMGSTAVDFWGKTSLANSAKPGQ
jgi:unsaturated chondroitin disaccharide hydrolase